MRDPRVIILFFYVLLAVFIGYKVYDTVLDRKKPESLLNRINEIHNDADFEIP